MMPNLRIQKQRRKFTEYFKDHGMVQSINAMKLVDDYHTGKRRTGQPESSHLYEVAGQMISFLAERISDYELDCVVAASFLHDLVEDYSDQFNEKLLRKQFITLTSDLVMNVCKWDGFVKDKTNYKVYFNNVQKHYLSVFIKVSDRIHNLATCIGGMSKKRIHEYIYETETYFYPMIKATRKENKSMYMILTSMKQQLEYRIEMLRFITDNIDL